jgi:hypothetical protein
MTGKNKRALFIGINYVGTSAALNGCWNDVYVMRDFFSKNGYSQITIMSDEESNKNNGLFPTRNNVIRQISEFVNSGKPNETLFLYFSGHGGNRPDRNRDERDGLDETICVFAEDRNTITAISDDELRSILECLRSDVIMRCFFDCCHSGTILDLPYRWFSGRVANLESRPMNKNILMISGCADNECSHEAYISQNGESKVQGALTFFLLQTLNENRNIRWVDLVSVVQRKLKLFGYQQVPQTGFCNSSVLGNVCDI